MLWLGSNDLWFIKHNSCTFCSIYCGTFIIIVKNCTCITCRCYFCINSWKVPAGKSCYSCICASTQRHQNTVWFAHASVFYKWRKGKGMVSVCWRSKRKAFQIMPEFVVQCVHAFAWWRCRSVVFLVTWKSLQRKKCDILPPHVHLYYQERERSKQ